jgi:hypothetical protein
METPTAYTAPDSPMTCAAPDEEAPTAYAGVPQSGMTRQPEAGLLPHDTTEIPPMLPEPEPEDADWFWSTTDHPPAGLPESLRLPAGIPEGLWHPADREPLHDDRPTHEQPAYVETPEHAAPEYAAPEHNPESIEVPDFTALPSNAYPPSALPNGAPRNEPLGHDTLQSSVPYILVPHQTEPAAAGAQVVEIDRTSPPPDVDGPPVLREKLTPSDRRLLRRRRRVTFVAYLMVVALVLVVGHELRDRQQPTAAEQETAQRAAEPIGAVAPRLDPDQEKRDQLGSVQGVTSTAGEATGKAGHFRYVKTRGPLLGKSGELHRFKVAVEESVPGVEPSDFSRVIDRTLGDKRSWIASGKLRVRRVPKSAKDAEFTIYLATPATSERMCAAGGLHTEGFTSCRVPGQVIINADRWALAVPDYAGDLGEYRQYAINHEVGHQLGHGHESCPGKGKPAPVMLQQTYGLDGCVRNAWPYVSGKRYSGEPTP